VPELTAAVGPRKVDERDHLEDEDDVGRADVLAQSVRLLGAVVKRNRELAGLAGEPSE
jgi:hypothetical protein